MLLIELFLFLNTVIQAHIDVEWTDIFSTLEIILLFHECDYLTDRQVPFHKRHHKIHTSDKDLEWQLNDFILAESQEDLSVASQDDTDSLEYIRHEDSDCKMSLGAFLQVDRLSKRSRNSRQRKKSYDNWWEVWELWSHGQWKCQAFITQEIRPRVVQSTLLGLNPLTMTWSLQVQSPLSVTPTLWTVVLSPTTLQPAIRMTTLYHGWTSALSLLILFVQRNLRRTLGRVMWKVALFLENSLSGWKQSRKSRFVCLLFSQPALFILPRMSHIWGKYITDVQRLSSFIFEKQDEVKTPKTTYFLLS